TGDSRARDNALAQAASVRLPEASPPIDRITWLRIMTLKIKCETDATQSGTLVQSLLEQLKTLTESGALAPARVTRLRSFLELTQRTLIERSAKAPATDRALFEHQVESIEQNLETIFKLALSGEQEPDLQTFLTYADHLRFRRQRERCLEVVDQALKSPQ